MGVSEILGGTVDTVDEPVGDVSPPDTSELDGGKRRRKYRKKTHKKSKKHHKKSKKHHKKSKKHHKKSHKKRGKSRRRR